MSEVKGKYLKDENGEIFSPITSASSIVAVPYSSLGKIKLDYFYQGYLKYVNASSIKNITFSGLEFEKNCFYDFNIAGTISGDAGSTGSILFKPNIRITWSK